jgi:hypothetical protein
VGTHGYAGKSIYNEVAKVLYSQGLIDSPEPRNPGKELGYADDALALRGGKEGMWLNLGLAVHAQKVIGYDAWGGNSRSSADRLRALGWKKEEANDVVASIEHEVDAILVE